MVKRVAGRAVLVLALFSLVLSAQEQEAPVFKSTFPGAIKTIFDGLAKTNASNGIYNIQYVNSFFFPGEQSVFVNLLFTADLDAETTELKDKAKAKHDEFVASEQKKIEEFNKKAKKEEDKKTFMPPTLAYPPAFHVMYVRFVKDGNIIEEHRANIPFDDQKTEYYSFGIVMNPGDFDVYMVVNRTDNLQYGTRIMKLTVPQLTITDILKPKAKLEISTPVFYKEDYKQLTQAAGMEFQVKKNSYVFNPQNSEYFPYIGAAFQFKASDTPILSFFISGIVMVQGENPCDITIKMEIRRGKDSVLKFGELKQKTPMFWQPIEFTKAEKDFKKTPIPAGDYTLKIELKDNNNPGDKGKGEADIPFKISE